MNNYTVTHLHTDYSSGVTNIDSITKYDAYIKYAKELGMSAIAFTEHGNIFSWVKKKEACEKNGLKYIHAAEVYITKGLEEKVRDNNHTCLYALNYDGVKELNSLLSISFNREDGHYYYNPRITIDEFCGISKNIAVTTACIGGVLGSNDSETKKKYLKYIVENKDRCFLEIQHHNTDSQKKHNLMLMKIKEKFGLRFISGTDTHCLNEDHVDGRKILQRSKNVIFENEDGWDLTFKSYDELIESYKKQGIFDEEIYIEAINNTNVLADMVEEFKLDRSNKYPKMSEDPEVDLKRKISEGIIWRGVNKYPNFMDYKERIVRELKTYKVQKAIDFLLLEEKYKSDMRKDGVFCGYSRGSVSGSVIAYLLGITDVDSIKHNLNFERFMHMERISLADVDSDWYKEDRPKIKKYIHNMEGVYCCEIITFNTIGLKGAIRDVGRALNISLDVVDKICKDIDEDIDGKIGVEDEYREKYPELFRYVDLLNGVIVSVGNHPAGTVVSPYPIDEIFGTFTTKTCEYPVSQINMKEIDGLNFLKLDVLGLDNVGIINKTCKLVGIDRLIPENMDVEDVNVWNSIRDNTLGIFQWESASASKYLKKLLSDETIKNIKESGVKLSYMDLLSIGNGAIRPAGESYREELAKGIVKDNGHPALNEFMENTLGYMVYQEQIIEFLNRFCGYTMGEADLVRRAFAKKTGTDEHIPRIKDGFIKTMGEKYNTSVEDAENIVDNFLQVIIDASDYLFSLNHSDPYSYIGYACGYLRYHYPLEFLTSMFNVKQSNIDDVKGIEKYCNELNIEIMQPRFGMAKGEYFYSKENNQIYKGVGSIKGLGVKDGDELYELSRVKFESFTELYMATKRDTSVDTGKIRTLIKLNYFIEYGKSKRLLEIAKLCDDLYDRKQISKSDLNKLGLTKSIMEKYANKVTEKLYKEIDMSGVINEIAKGVKDEDISIKERMNFEVEALGFPVTTIADLKNPLYLVLDIKSYKNKRSITHYPLLYNIKDGDISKFKVKDYVLFADNKFDVGNIISILEKTKEPKKDKTGRKIDGFNIIIDHWEVY